jgi:hypothetical protein
MGCEVEPSSTGARRIVEIMEPAVRDFGRLFEGVPRGAWVAIAQDESRVVAYAAEMKEAIRKAQELGEHSSIIARVPQSPAAFAY